MMMRTMMMRTRAIEGSPPFVRCEHALSGRTTVSEGDHHSTACLQKIELLSVK